MNKAELEEAHALAVKHGIYTAVWPPLNRLVALIAEVRSNPELKAIAKKMAAKAEKTKKVTK